MPLEREIGSGRTRYERPGEEYEQPFQMPFARWVIASPGYFDSLDVEILAGRDFGNGDFADAPKVAIVNQDFAEKEWPGENPIGKRIDIFVGEEEEAKDPQAGWVEVVGMVPDMRFAEFDNEDDQQAIYVPMAQNPVRFAWLVVETHGEPGLFGQTLREEVLAMDADLRARIAGLSPTPPPATDRNEERTEHNYGQR